MLAEVFPPSALRIKKQIEGRSHSFALVLPPGLEALAIKEAEGHGFVREQSTTIEKSIFEFTGRMADLYRASTQLRLAGRILLRLADFHASAREELFRHAYKIPWELWLSPANLVVDAHIKTSKISHEGMASQTIIDAIKRRWLAAGLQQEQSDIEHRVLLRIEDNRAKLSLDASGIGLYHRGWRTEQGPAPLRENLAAGILTAAGWPDQVSLLLDPMCGSGTFSVEAWGIRHGLPAAAERHFAFFDWPVFNQKTFDYQSRSQNSAIKDELVSETIWTADINETIVDKAKRNFERYAINLELARQPTKPHFFVSDFFEIDAQKYLAALGSDEERPGLLALNPPYGLRLESGNTLFFEKLYAHIKEHYKGWRVALVALSQQAPPQSIKRFKQSLKLRHGGLDTEVWFLEP